MASSRAGVTQLAECQLPKPTVPLAAPSRLRPRPSSARSVSRVLTADQGCAATLCETESHVEGPPPSRGMRLSVADCDPGSEGARLHVPFEVRLVHPLDLEGPSRPHAEPRTMLARSIRLVNARVPTPRQPAADKTRANTSCRTSPARGRTGSAECTSALQNQKGPIASSRQRVPCSRTMSAARRSAVQPRPGDDARPRQASREVPPSAFSSAAPIRLRTEAKARVPTPVVSSQ